MVRHQLSKLRGILVMVTNHAQRVGGRNIVGRIIDKECGCSRHCDRPQRRLKNCGIRFRPPDRRRVNNVVKLMQNAQPRQIRR